MDANPETIQSFAELVLFSPVLDTKLATPSRELIDSGPSSAQKICTPEFPGRPDGLSLDPAAKKSRSSFPARSALSDGRARGLVLHFFANHELLALELMALALLKWPDAPPGFRRGIVQTMIEEQNHMRLYLDRMKDLQVEFGEAPLNAFFWNCMKDLESPAEYTAAMSMTFEQANLDFALHYENLFRVEGDDVTAAIMKRVRMEEIGHLKHGVVWFERWRSKQERLFKEWQDTLHFPITPARAKGLSFDRVGRSMAGLPKDFIDELEVHNQSKGRPPKVFWFNPGCEQEIEFPGHNWTPPKPIQSLTKDYETLMSFLGHKDDIVMVHKIPSVAFLKSLDDLGFEIPEFVRHNDLKSLSERKFASFEPWGWSPAAIKYFDPLKSKLLSDQGPLDRTAPTADSSIFSKKVASDIRTRFNLDSVPTIHVTSIDSTMAAIGELSKMTDQATVVFKAPFSASGRGMLRIKDGVMSEKDRNWIESVIKTHGVILAEPWLKKIADLSAHVDVSPDGQVKFVGITRFWTDSRGQYRGHILGRILDDFDTSMIRLWHAENGWQQSLRETAINVGKEAHQRGYSGPLGIDAFIYKTNGELKLRPMIEINPRWSMGRVAIAISTRLAAKHCGIWIHISKSELKRANYDSYLDLVSALQTFLPTKIKALGRVKTIHAGAFALNEPSTAVQSLALLVVGRDFNECHAALKKSGIHDQQLDLAHNSHHLV